MTRRVVVGFSGGVTSAWCAGWALRNFPREEIVLLWHNTHAEDPDTYRFLRAMAAKLGLPITERSDGRSPTQLFRDEGFLGNGQNAMCSRILKRAQGEAYVRELKASGCDEVIRVFGFTGDEPDRVHRMCGFAVRDGFVPRFPLIEERVTKQAAADWCTAQGVCPSDMYRWSGHANCVGCIKGGRAYWLLVAENAPDVFEHFAQMEEEFGHTIIRGELRKGETEHPTLRKLVQIGLKRKVVSREAITIGACECGD